MVDGASIDADLDILYNIALLHNSSRLIKSQKNHPPPPLIEQVFEISFIESIFHISNVSV